MIAARWLGLAPLSAKYRWVCRRVRSVRWHALCSLARNMLSGIAIWLAMFGLWMLLVGSTDLPEIVFGVASATVASAGFVVVRARDDMRVRFRPRQIAILLRRLPPKVLVDCGRVLGAAWSAILGRPISGQLVRVPFRPGSPDNPDDAARRALVVFGISLAPNTVVVRIDQARRAGAPVIDGAHRDE